MGRGFVLVNETSAGCRVLPLPLALGRRVLAVRRASRRRAGRRRRSCGGSGRAGCSGSSREVAPDVVVSVYPMTTEVLGGLRRSGRLDVPVVAAITDLAMMHYWAAPGIDLHLVTHPESIEEVRRSPAHDAVVRAVHGLTRPEFGEPCDPSEARRALGLPARRQDRARLGRRLGRRRSRKRRRRGARRRGRRGRRRARAAATRSCVSGCCGAMRDEPRCASSASPSR